MIQFRISEMYFVTMSSLSLVHFDVLKLLAFVGTKLVFKSSRGFSFSPVPYD